METKPTVEQFRACIQAIQEHLKRLKEYDLTIETGTRLDIDPGEGITVELYDGAVYQECADAYDWTRVPVNLAEAFADDPLTPILERSAPIKVKLEAEAAKLKARNQRAKLAKEKADRAIYERLRKKFEKGGQNS